MPYDLIMALSLGLFFTLTIGGPVLLIAIAIKILGGRCEHDWQVVDKGKIYAHDCHQIVGKYQDVECRTCHKIKRYEA